MVLSIGLCAARLCATPDSLSPEPFLSAVVVVLLLAPLVSCARFYKAGAFSIRLYNYLVDKKIANLKELEREAEEFAHNLRPHTDGTATLVLLSGELGAGKTAFTKAVAEALGVKDVVNSPTFVLEKIYALPSTCPFRRLVHIDAYRLEGADELGPIGFDEIMKDERNLVLFEWPEKVSAALPREAVRISLKAYIDGSRELSYA